MLDMIKNPENLDSPKEVGFSKAIAPIAFFFSLLIYGLLIHPQWVDHGRMLPLEVLVLIAISFTSVYLLILGYSWDTIQKHIVKKVADSLPVVFILFAIGVLIGSWMVSGTIPMLIYYGISMINPDWIYIFTFIICIIFSLLTGTSWGSAGTIGVVMMGITQVYDANLAITAGAVVGGSFFGDKLSPLSDTTNIASLATGVPLYQHIHSMLFTTGPAAILAACLYIYLSPSLGGDVMQGGVENLEMVNGTLSDISSIFNFNLLLLLPMVIVIYGTVKKKSIFLTLLNSSWVAMVLAFIFQDFSLTDVFMSFKSGFKNTMSSANISEDSSVLMILNRGGLYNLIEGIVVSLLVFTFIGVLDVINAIEVSIKSLMKLIKKRYQLVASALTATWITNITTSNQYATSFIIGSAFANKFDKLKVNRKVLSRSIEDAGTMMENLMPWTPSGIFMLATLGVHPFEYAPYQFMSLINIAIAYLFAFTGIACFYNKSETHGQKTVGE